MQWWTIYVIAGALSFWGPEVLLAGIIRRPFNDYWYLVSPLLVFSCYLSWRVAYRRKVVATIGGPSAAGCMLLGIYLLGPWLMLLEATLVGAGYFELRIRQSWWLTVLAASFFPPYTLMLSGYDGSFFALVAISGLLVRTHIKREKGDWILPFRRHRSTQAGGSAFRQR